MVVERQSRREGLLSLYSLISPRDLYSSLHQQPCWLEKGHLTEMLFYSLLSCGLGGQEANCYRRFSQIIWGSQGGKNCLLSPKERCNGTVTAVMNADLKWKFHMTVMIPTLTKVSEFWIIFFSFLKN